jgi:hypothetical protein
MAVLNYRRADHPFRCRPSDMPSSKFSLPWDSSTSR